MNDEALRRTRETGEMWFWSRSRQELWHKGATSGNVQRLKELRLDCDEDAILALVEPAGPACHTGGRTCFHHGEREAGAGGGRGGARCGTGERTCFHNGEREPVAGEALATLERTIEERREAAPEESYTARLLADRELVGRKVREEAEEVARAAREEPDERVAEEAADVLYHLAGLVAGGGMELSDAYEVLNGRRRCPRADAVAG